MGVYIKAKTAILVSQSVVSDIGSIIEVDNLHITSPMFFNIASMHSGTDMNIKAALGFKAFTFIYYYRYLSNALLDPAFFSLCLPNIPKIQFHFSSLIPILKSMFAFYSPVKKFSAAHDLWLLSKSLSGLP